MNHNRFSPYIRHANYSTIVAPFLISERIIYDHELIYVMDGMCEITVSGENYTVKKGDFVFFPPDVPHELRSIGDTPFVQPHIHFDAVYGDKSERTPISFKAKNKMSAEELSLIQANAFDDCHIPYVFRPTQKDEFLRLFFEIIEIFREKKRGYTILYKVKMLELFELIYRQFEKISPFDERDDVGRGDTSSIKSYIDANYRQIITLDRLSMQFFVNKYTLLRSFKEQYGMGIISYYRAMRLEYAKKCLLKTNLSVTEISESLNFTDVYTFSRFFKSYTGISPREYRKSHGEK